MRNKHQSTYLKNRNRFTMTEEISVKENSIPLVMKITVALSSVQATIGLVFTLMGSLFLFFILPLVSFNSVDVPDDAPIVMGEITEIYSTNTEINDRNVLEYHYRFKDKTGAEFSGVSFSHKRNEQIGDNVKVRYNSEIPEESIIVGMSSESFPMWVLLFVGIFPLVGVLMLYFGLKKGLRNVKIIQFGKVAFGTYKNRESTNASVNKQTVYKFYFDFSAADGNTYTATGETHHSFKLEDEDREPIIYNSVNPEEAVLVDTLPKSVRRFFKKEIDKKINH